VLSKGFEIETEMTIHALDKRFSLVERTIGYRDRPEGSVSKLNTFSDGFKVIRTILLLFKNYRPFRFFGIIALVLIILATVLFIPIFIDFLNTGFVPKIPTLLFCVGMAIMSLLSFICGVILDTIKHYNDIQYELFINLLKVNRNR
jgi:hypothetical protein